MTKVSQGQVELVSKLVKSVVGETVPSRDELAEITRDTCVLLDFTDEEITQMIREIECLITFKIEQGVRIK
jgi:hypothetical protein